MANEDRLKLFKAIDKAGYNIGSYEDFDRRMNNAEDRQKFFTAINDAGYDIGSQEDFERRISPSKYKLTVAGNEIPVSEKEYMDFLSRHQGGSTAKPKPQQTPDKPYSGQTVNAENGYTFTEAGLDSLEKGATPVYQPSSVSPSPAKTPDDPVLGTPWGSDGSATGKSTKYQPFAPGQKRETGDPGASQFGTPFKPDTQLTAAQRDEIHRQNDYAVRQIQKIQEEQRRRSQPLVDTGSKEANRSVIKTQGQWEDDLEKGARRIVGSVGGNVSAPAIDKAISEFDKLADKAAQDYQNGVRQYTPGSTDASALFSVKAANEARDPEKVLGALKGQIENVYNNQDFINNVAAEADRAGIDRGEYLEKIIKPQIEADLTNRLRDTLVKREMPQSTIEYVMGGLSNSIAGMLFNAITETKGLRSIKNEAEAITEEGKNPYFTPGTASSLTKMGVSFAADAPFFGLYGKVSGAVAKKVAERQIQNLIAKGLSENAARSIVGTALENSVGARMKNYLMQHVISSSLTMGAYNASSELARQTRDKEGYDLGAVAQTTAEGLATGAAFGVTGAVSQALSQPLSGIAKVGAKAAGFVAEAETLYATEELAKMAHGEEGFENPFEGSVEALEKLAVMKASGGHLLTSAGEKIMRAKEVGVGQAAAETVAGMLGQNRSGIKFSKEEQDYVRNTAEGQSLVEALSQMHPEIAFSEVNGKRQLTPEGEQLRRQLSDNYQRFMTNTEVPAIVKQKVAGMLGGVYRPGLETGADITHNADGSVIVKTRDKDGNCVRDLKFDSFSEAEQWREDCEAEFRLNDATNMWNGMSDEQKYNTIIDVARTFDPKFKNAEKIVRQALDANDTSLDPEQYNYVYDAISRNYAPADEYNPRARYEEGRKVSPEERHIAMVDAQVKEEQLHLFGDDFANDIISNAQYADEKMAEFATRKDITKEQIEAARDYYNTQAKLSGMMDEALKSVDEQVEAANAEIRRNTHPDSGALISGTARGKNVYVTAGHFQITPDGRIVSTDKSGAIIVRDVNTGDIDVVSPTEILVDAVNDPNRMIEANNSNEGLRGQLLKQADDSIELAPGTPEYPEQDGEVFTGADGKQYMTMQTADETGNPVWLKAELDINGEPVGEPQPLDIDEYRKSKSNEIDAANRPQEEVATEESGQEIVPGTEEIVPKTEDNTGGEAGITEDAGADEPPVVSRIPVDEKGKKQYEKATAEDTMAELTEKFGEDEARQMVSQIAESSARELDKLQQTDTSGITDMADLETHKDNVKAAKEKADYWQGLVKRYEEADAKMAETIAQHNSNILKANTLDELEAAYKAAIDSGVKENDISEAYNAKKSWINLVNPKEIRNFATDPESQAKWVDEHFDEIVDSYIKTHGNLLDPDKLRDALTPIGYDGKNVPDYREQEKRIVRAIYDKMLQKAVESGNTSITLLTGPGGAGKSTATENMDFSDRGLVYDSALNDFKSINRVINRAKELGMKDVRVVAVYNDANTAFENTVKRGLEKGRFLSLDYFVSAYQKNQGKIAQLRQAHPDVEIIGIDNSGNKSTERPNRGLVSAEDIDKWDYEINDAKLNELLNIFENGINSGRFTEDQAASIGRGLRNVTRSIRDITPATIERIDRIGGRIRQEDVGDLRPGISGEQRGSGRSDVVPPTDGEIQESSNQPGNEGESGEVRNTPPANGSSGGPEPPAAGASGAGSVRSGQHGDTTGGNGASGSGGTGLVSGTGNPGGGSETRPGGGSGSSGNNLGGTGSQNQGGKGPTAGTDPLEIDQKTGKLYQKRVEANLGRSFTFNKPDGGTAIMTIHRINHDGNAVITRQDFDAQGNAVGEPREVRYHFTRVADAIGKGTWKKNHTTDETLKKVYKYNFMVGDVPVLDVLTEEEQQQILEAYRMGDKETVGQLTSDFINQHRDDFILRGRDIRNEKVEKAFAKNGKGERLRTVREQYKGFEHASTLLEDAAMQPTTLEEAVADALGDVPKPGTGVLAYTSYKKGENEIVGLKDETGFGSRGFNGDTKGFNPWLAPAGQGMSLKQFAEMIHEQLPEGIKEQFTDQDIRNAIRDVLTGAEKPTDIANYILRNRVEQAEAEARHEEEEWMDAPVFQKVVDGNSFASRLKRAKEEVNTEPSDKQKDAGNYKKGHLSFGGYDLTIENPEGSIRRGETENPDGTKTPWENKMNNTYGYILGKYGKDGDHLDMFINDKADLDNWNGNVYVIDQIDPKTGKFDEHKVMYGFDSEAEAREAYLANYEKGWKGLGKITGVSKETFDKWLDSSDRKIKEFADHSIVKNHMVERMNTAFDSALQKLDEREISIDDPQLMKEYGLKNITLSRYGNHLTLSKIVVDSQGQGNGTRFMTDLARLADEKGWTLALTPDTSFGGTSVKRLKDFYKRFGFKDNKGRYTDFETRESMIRRPKDYQPMSPEQQEQIMRDVVVEHLRKAGIEVSDDWKLGQRILDDYNSRNMPGIDGEVDVKPQKVSDQQTLEQLEKGPTVKRYRAMQLIDGKLYPPMSAKVDGAMREPTEIGVWEQAEERPDLIKNGKFVLNKGQKGQGNVPAAYNPYFHTSTSGLNDQFTSAYKRPELVVVEVEIPESELTSGYKAEGAKDAVGNVDWHSGVVNGQLPADRQRQVTLSRYSKVNRVVPDSEVADMIAKQLEGTNVEVPYNVVTPQLRKALEERGVKISDKPAGSVTEDINGNPIKQQKVDNETIFNAAKNLFGTTNDIREAGYILPDGTMPDFSGRNTLDPGTDDSFLKGTRTTDHRDIKNIAYEKDGNTRTGIESDMPDFIRRGAIRIDDNSGNINLSTKPTEQQKKILKKLIRDNDGYVQVDFGDGWDSSHYVEYDGAKAERVLADIDRYFDEGIKPEGDIKYFKTKDGHAYGYTYKGKIYLDPRIATSETPIHEYSHLWAEMKRQTSPEEWNHIKEVMLNDKFVQPIIERVKRDYPELTKEGKEDDFIEEIITQFSGKRGSERLREIANEIAAENGGVFGRAEAVTAMQRLKNILNRFWEGVAKMMGWKYRNASQIADRILSDMLNGVNPRNRMKNESKRIRQQHETERTLMGVHNLSEEKLRKVLKQGGLANPSMAVIDTDQHMHTDYGDISLIPKASLIDAKTGRNAGTFTADAWTPSYPRVERRMSDKGHSKFWKDLRKLNEEAGEVSNYTRMAFDTWLDQKAEGYGVEEWLYNGTDNQGRHKYVRNTLENASRLMRKEGLNGATNWSSIGNWIAKVANKEKTLQGIRKHKKNLATSKEEHEAFHDEWGRKLYDIASRLGSGDMWNGENILGDILDHSDYAGYYKREYGDELTKQEKDTIDEFIKQVRTNFPTGYFETKFERPVYLNEFEIAVVPENASPDIVEALKNAGLDVRTYDDTGEESVKDANRRKAAMDAVSGRDDIMFQMVGRSGAATADMREGKSQRMDDMKVAEEMEKAGKDSRLIKLATGWERGKDGQWRYETVDASRDILSIYEKKIEDIEKEYQEQKKELDSLTDEWNRQNDELLAKVEPGGEGLGREEYKKALEPIAKKVREKKEEVEHLRNLTSSYSPIIKLGELLGKDNDLFKYYPELKYTDVLFSNTMDPGTAGSFDGDNISINVNETRRIGNRELDNESVYGTLLHEIQHAIQDIEGFAKGGSMTTATTAEGMDAIIRKKQERMDDLRKRIDANRRILDNPEDLKLAAELDNKSEKEEKESLQEQIDEQAAEYDNIKLQIDRIKGLQTVSMTDARNLYQNLAGEVEARNVSNRSQMTEDERRRSLAEETEDVDRNDQVVIMGDGTALNINDIKPVGTGDFGDVYDQFKGKPKEAADFLIKKRKGDVEGVFHRDELGDVDLVWGKHEDHQGLEHMIIDHVIEANDFESVEQMMEVIDDVIKNGQKEKRNSEDKARFEKDGYLVSVRKQYRDNTGQIKYKKNWVVTAFDTSRKEKEKKRSQEEADAKRREIFGKKETSPKGTLTTPPLNPEADGVTLPSSDVLSEGKDTKNIDNLQEISGNSLLDRYYQDINKLSKSIFDKTDITEDDARNEAFFQTDSDPNHPLRKEAESRLKELMGDKAYKDWSAEETDQISRTVPLSVMIEQIKMLDDKMQKSTSIQGLEGYTEKDVTDLVEQHFMDLTGDEDLQIVGMKVIGSRTKGRAKYNSDLDVLLEYKGDIREDDLFNLLNDEDNRLYIEGIPVDINPITRGKGGTIEQWLKRNANYDKENENNSLKFQRVSSPEPELTPEERQYWKKWDADIKKWKERNAIAENADGPSEKPHYTQGETAIDYAKKLAQWNREKALWQTAPKLEDYRKKREDKDILESARENEKRYPASTAAKMRRVAAELQQIRTAMRQQKEYDKATVKAVTDFAQDFMKQGFGDNLSRGEMERMLSSVKNATGARDIKKHVDNIMNILIDNHLRNLDQRVQKLSSTKELSKTAQGVEKQGKLELKGQKMIQSFRKAREMRMPAEDIRQRMGELVEKMNRNDEEAPMWEQEYEGLSIALQYAENIEGSRTEWAELDREYKDAVAEYKGSGRSYKAQQELLEAIDQAMQENKIERIGLFGDIIGRLEGDISESMEGAREFVEREKQRQKHIWDMANYDLAGKDMGAMREKVKGKPSNFFLQPLCTFEQMLRQFGSRNANGEGYLYDYFMRNWMDVTDKAYIDEQKAKKELDAKAREVFGDKVKRWSDLYGIERNMPMMEVEVLDGNEPKTFKLTQGNLLYIYMADKMADGRMKLRKMGIDEETVDRIKDFLDPRLVELGDWLQQEYLTQKRTEYNKVHERMFGAPMAAIDNYFPLKVLGDARYQEQDVNVPDSETLPSTITGNIIKRRKNALPLDILHTDALSLAVEHVEDMERWAAQAEWNKDVNTLLSYTTFRNKVKNMDTIYGSGDALWNAFKDAAKIAAGTYNPSAKSGHIDKAISNIAKGVTAAKINFRVYTAFKQILSAPAFLHDVRIDDFVKNSVNPYGSWKWAMENMAVFEKRWKSRQVGDTRLMDDPTDWKMWKTNIVQMATRMGMSPNALVDGVTCAVGAKSIYENRYRRYKEIGASDEVARKRALQDAEIGYNLTQQSSEGAFVSAIQMDRTVAANMLSVFRNSSMAYTRQWVDAARNLRKRAQKGYKEDSIKFMAYQMQEQFGIDEAQAKKAAEAEYAREGRRDVARLLNMMFGVTVAWNLGASLPYLLIGDDDNTKKEMMTDALLKGLMSGPTEGFAAGNIFSDFIGRTLASEQTRSTFREEGIGAATDQTLKQGGDYEINPLPLMADIQSMIGKLGYDKYAAAQDVFNIVMQSAVGVNPQTFTDMWNAAMDYGAPGWDGTSYTADPENMGRAKEIALFMMRLMNAPTSSWRNKYVDELGMNAEDAKKLPYEEMARRYAHYKHWKDAPVMGWLRGDEARAEKIAKIQGQFDKAVEERMQRLTDKELMYNVAHSESAEEKRRYAKIIAKRMRLTPVQELTGKQDLDKDWYQYMYQQRMQYDDIRDETLLDAKLKEYREKDAHDNTKREIRKRLDWIRDGKWDTPSGKKGNSKNAKLLLPGKKQFDNSSDGKANDAIMVNIRKWRKEALEIIMRAESKD